MRKKLKKSNKKSGRIFSKPHRLLTFFVGFLVLILMVFNLSLIISVAGDNLLTRDQYDKAKQFYTFSRILNPLNEKATKGLNVIDVIQKERTFELHSSHIPVIKEKKDLALQPTAGEVAPAHVIKLPILMYHYVRVNPVKEDIAGFYLSVTPQDFDTHMKYLVDHGYTSITLDDLLAALLQNKKLPDKSILITFDDGYRDSYTEAFPVLKKYGLKAVNFIPTSFVDTPRYLTWEMIKEMQKSGTFMFASHTMTHLSLTSVSNEVALYELVESKKTLEKELGIPVQWFAYPYGHMDERVSKLVKEAGYFGAFGTNEGSEQSSDYIYSLPRIRIGGGMSLEMFAAKLPWK